MNEVVNKINYDEIRQIIENQLIEVMNQDKDFYNGYSIKITNELQFVKKIYKDNPKCICIVLKFGAASVNYFQSIVPATIMALSEQDHVYVARKLMTEFVEYFNLVRVSGDTIQQLYTTPVVSDNFQNEITGFKSLISTSAAFIVSKNANFFYMYNVFGELSQVPSGINIENAKITNLGVFADFVGYNFAAKGKIVYKITKTNTNYQVYDENNTLIATFTSVDPIKARDEFGVILSNNGSIYVTLDTESVPVLSQNFGVNYNLDSQIMYQKKNFSSSISKYGTITVTFSTYFMDDIHLFNDALKVSLKKNTGNVGSGVNHTFALYFEFKNGETFNDSFKLLNFNADQKIGEIPTSAYVFTN